MEDLISRAAAACGGMNKLAAAMGEEPQVVSNWRKRGVPLHKCALLEAACGQVVRRWEMRPDDWRSVWPELIGTPGAPDAPTPAQPAEAA